MNTDRAKFLPPEKEEIALYASAHKASTMEHSLNYIINNNEYLTSLNANFGCLHSPNIIYNLKKNKEEITYFVMISVV